MKKQIFIPLIIISSLFISCSGSYENKDMSASEQAYAEEEYTGKLAEQDNLNDEAEQRQPINSADATKVVERKLIKTGNVSFETENLTQTQLNILNAVKNLNGYISSDNEYKSYYQISHTLTIRVPADNFDKLISIISEGVEHFDNKSIDIQDVTEE